MKRSTSGLTARTAVVALAVVALAAACGGGDAGLNRAEVAEIVRDEMAAQAQGALTPGMVPADVEGIVDDALSQTPPPEPGLSRADIEGIVNDALTETPPPEPGLSRAEIADIVTAAIASIPSKASPAEYTRHVVENAIARYEAQGLEATLAHYNRPESVDGQWYVFIIDEDDLVIAHPDADRRGLDLKGWVGTDINGYEFGPEMLAATEDGKWVSYVYRNPESGGIRSGDFELKNVWVERRDGLLFASGWYIDADAFTRMLVSIAVDKYRELGLAGTMAYFASPGSALAGLEAAVAYYNDAESVGGQWFAFIGDPEGKIAGHSDPSMIGRDVQELFGAETPAATADGGWVESESLRVWVAGYDGYLFGSGWRQDG